MRATRGGGWAKVDRAAANPATAVPATMSRRRNAEAPAWPVSSGLRRSARSSRGFSGMDGIVRSCASDTGRIAPSVMHLVVPRGVAMHSWRVTPLRAARRRGGPRLPVQCPLPRYIRQPLHEVAVRWMEQADREPAMAPEDTLAVRELAQAFFAAVAAAQRLRRLSNGARPRRRARRHRRRHRRSAVSRQPLDHRPGIESVGRHARERSALSAHSSRSSSANPVATTAMRRRCRDSGCASSHRSVSHSVSGSVSAPMSA